MSDVLLLPLHFESTLVCLEFSHVDSVFVFLVFQSHLGFFFELGQLVQVLEEQVVQSVR